MTNSVDEDFLKHYRIDFPDKSSLAVIHAEPVSLIPMRGYTFSDDAKDLIRVLIIDKVQTVDEFLCAIASHDEAPRYSVIFFLDGPYHLAGHIYAVRESMEEVAMLSCNEDWTPELGRYCQVGALFFNDVPTMASLAERSPFLGQLFSIADGPPDDAIWTYFLGKADSKEEETGEGVKIPIKKFEPTTQ